jgi:uncharacterized membrane protein YeaQ/YmgE (transglycosylase-associated protein family)
MGIIAWIFAGLIAGWLTGKTMKGSGYGFFGDILLGIVGAVVGGYLSRHLLGVDTGGSFWLTVLIALGGAIILVALVRLIKR